MMHSDNELHEASKRHLDRRRVVLVGALVLAVVVGVQPLLGLGGLVSELWLGVLVSLGVLLVD